MKTAKEIISEYGWENVWTHKMMEEIINTARKEAIEECFGKVGAYSYDMGRTEILALIKELK